MSRMPVRVPSGSSPRPRTRDTRALLRLRRHHSRSQPREAGPMTSRFSRRGEPNDCPVASWRADWQCLEPCRSRRGRRRTSRSGGRRGGFQRRRRRRAHSAVRVATLGHADASSTIRAGAETYARRGAARTAPSAEQQPHADPRLAAQAVTPKVVLAQPVLRRRHQSVQSRRRPWRPYRRRRRVAPRWTRATPS